MRVAFGQGREIVRFRPDNERFPAADLPDRLINFLEGSSRHQGSGNKLMDHMTDKHGRDFEVCSLG